MQEIIFGVLSGIVTALGMGGGTVLILLFGLFTEIEQHVIQGVNLIVFIPTALISILLNLKEKSINLKLAKSVIISGIFGAILGSFLSFKFSNVLLKKIFGIFLLLIAIMETYSFFTKYILKEKVDNKNKN